MSLHLAAILLLLSYFVQLQYFYYALSSLRITGWYSEMRTPAKILDHQNYAGYRSKFFLGVKWFCSCRKEQKKKVFFLFVCFLALCRTWHHGNQCQTWVLRNYSSTNTTTVQRRAVVNCGVQLLESYSQRKKKKKKPDTVTFRKQNLGRARE